MAKLECKTCHNSYFKIIHINEYHDYGGNLYNTLPEVNVNSDIKAYECVKCGTKHLPTLDYSTSHLDKQIALTLQDLFDGKDPRPELKKAIARRAAPGYIGSVDTFVTPGQQGSFNKEI